MKVRKIGKRWKVFTYTLSYWWKRPGDAEWSLSRQKISRMDTRPGVHIKVKDCAPFYNVQLQQEKS